MQPYFFPYGGYYRLMAASDIFVVYDCVQFPRRGRVHRGQIPASHPGRPPEWVTLPLVKSPRDARIYDIQLAPDANKRLARYFARFGWVCAPDTPLRRKICALLEQPSGAVVDLLHDSLRLMRDACGFECDLRRSSELNIAPDLKGQRRIIRIAHSLGAQSYINSPGGKDLYSAASFADAGLGLRFLTPYTGAIPSMLQAIFTMDVEEIRDDILASTACEPVG